ncbi:hypothetical protein AAZX31_17G007900 [Glycine max]|uniref:F-box domain-containing protein n=2 Tax=Glycine subgen. Soja TaxID=1462606 RepID=I1MR05_SOYBN|nr:F-box protein CPR1 [Glycine max]XP_028210889.1 F-box protein CPR1-like [Glycine soja]KAG4929172.1 hypothetical protein JHK86_046133 [Glycine max]KAG4931902.1 hypothetical protein JHK87_045904 [Glycine soja]KAG5096380.1 hypothetical protein JHK82_046234 [Glycine max]KAG5101175.1 hypothetical protein JHK84_046144 [Glycine max]KAH1116127.1 hypothetical protein GYH30_045851 [Glycine max]|eukprot:XP_006600299.1 F-box protein CPR1 [Glycine max]
MHANPITVSNMANLPVEVVTEILSRLPVKSVIRLRSTCKWWRSIIDSRHFILFHLNKSHTSLILRHRSQLYSLDLKSLLDPNPFELSHPLMCYSNSIKVLGSSNGLLCISNVADDIALWNPFLRKHRILPSDRFHRPESSLFAARVYGFGHHPPSNDYKLLSITYFVDLHKRTFDSQVQLYTLKSDSWKNLPSMPYALCCARTMGVFVSGSLHWLVTRKLQPDEPDLIVAFDLTSETFCEVPLPATVNGNFDMQVALLGGCLCVVEHRGTGFHVWVMRVYGSRDSWEKLFSLTENHHHEMGSGKLKYVRPLALDDGDRVLFEHNRSKLCWYDLKTGDVSCVKLPSGIGNTIEGTVCVQSLVPPTLLSLRDESQEKNRKKRDDFLSKGFKLTL